jgi:hypothetical protein
VFEQKLYFVFDDVHKLAARFCSMAVEYATLNPLDCNLDIDLQDGNLTCSKLSNNGFGYLWAGARGNVGMMEGKAFFSVRVTQALPVNVQSKDDLSTAHIARVGLSRLQTPVGQLGEVRGRCLIRTDRR